MIMNNQKRFCSPEKQEIYIQFVFTKGLNDRIRYPFIKQKT